MAERRKWKWEEHAAELNEVERLKLKKDGLDVIQDIYRWAKSGYESIPEEDFVRLKWAGIYQQRPKDGHFMMRVRIPSGPLTSRQVRARAVLVRAYGRRPVGPVPLAAHRAHSGHVPPAGGSGASSLRGLRGLPPKYRGQSVGRHRPPRADRHPSDRRGIGENFPSQPGVFQFAPEVQNFRLVQRLQRDERPDPRPRLHAGGQGDRRKRGGRLPRLGGGRPLLPSAHGEATGHVCSAGAGGGGGRGRDPAVPGLRIPEKAAPVATQIPRGGLGGGEVPGGARNLHRSLSVPGEGPAYRVECGVFHRSASPETERLLLRGTQCADGPDLRGGVFPAGRSGG